MKMKLKMQLSALLLAAGTASAAQAATTGTLTFNGQIDGGTCNLAAGDVNRTITLPTVKVPDFDGVNSVGQTPFTLTAECDSDVANVVFTFTGTQHSADPYRFANTTGTAPNMGLWLYSTIGGTNATIQANGTNNTRTVPTTAGKAELPLGGAYWKTSAAVAKGTLVSVVTVGITYN